MSIFSHTQKHEIEANPFERRVGELLQRERIISGSLHWSEFRFDAMHICIWDPHVAQEQIPCLTVTAFRVMSRNATLIAPENMCLTPIHFFTKIRCKKLEETRRSAAAVQRHKKATALIDSMRGLLSKESCRVLTEFFQVLEDANFRFHT